MRNKHWIRIWALVAVIAIFAAACASSEDVASDTTIAVAPTTTVTLSPTVPELIPLPTTTTMPTTTTTTVPRTSPVALCESPDSALTLAEQQNACAGFVWEWLMQFKADAVSFFKLEILSLSPDGPKTLTISISALAGTEDSILRRQTERAQFSLYPVPEKWLSEKQLEEVDAFAVDATASLLAETEYWFGVAVFAFASYADLLDVDLIVLQIAYLAPETEDGWVYVNLEATPDAIMAGFPGTLGDMMVAINTQQDKQVFELYDKAFADVLDVFIEVATDEPEDVTEPSSDDGSDPEDVTAEDG